jgi:hypothetical protein
MITQGTFNSGSILTSHHFSHNSRPHVTKTSRERIENMEGPGSFTSPGVFSLLSPTGLSFVLISAGFLLGKKLYRSKKYVKSP